MKRVAPTSLRRRFVAIDEGLGTLLHVDERDPARDWLVPIGEQRARDMQLVGHDRVLIGHDRGYTEFELATGRAGKTFAGLEGVTAVRRQADGTTLIAGVNLDGASGVTVLTLGPEDRVLQRAVYAGDYVRLMRQTESGTYLMCCNDRIREAAKKADLTARYAALVKVEKALDGAKLTKLTPAGDKVAADAVNRLGVITEGLAAGKQDPQAVDQEIYRLGQILRDPNHPPRLEAVEAGAAVVRRIDANAAELKHRLSEIDENHEEFVTHGKVVASRQVKGLL